MKPGARCNPDAIGDLPGRESQFAHVVKHLYAGRERWDLALSALPTHPARAARTSGCSAIDLRSSAPSYHGACSTCREHVLGDHDRYLRPAYRRALVSAIHAERWGTWRDPQRPQDAFVGDDGVFVIARHPTRRTERRVATAYRVVPMGIRPDEATAQDFVTAAVRKLRDKTSYGEKDR